MGKHEHYWKSTGIPNDLVFLNSLWRFDCHLCGKQIWRRSIPVNPIVPSEWQQYKSEIAAENIAFVMSPPFRPDGRVYNIYGDQL